MKNLLAILFRFLQNWTGLRSHKRQYFYIAWAGGLISFLWSGKIAEWFMKFFPSFSHENLDVLNDLVASAENEQKTIIVVALGIVVPLLEELAFRGILWRFLEHTISVVMIRAVLVAMIFSIAHQELPHIIGVFPLALFLSWLRFKSNSIWPGFVAHSINNLLSVLTLMSAA